MSNETSRASILGIAASIWVEDRSIRAAESAADERFRAANVLCRRAVIDTCNVILRIEIPCQANVIANAVQVYADAIVALDQAEIAHARERCLPFCQPGTNFSMYRAIVCGHEQRTVSFGRRELGLLAMAELMVVAIDEPHTLNTRVETLVQECGPLMQSVLDWFRAIALWVYEDELDEVIRLSGGWRYWDKLQVLFGRDTKAFISHYPAMTNVALAAGHETNEDESVDHAADVGGSADGPNTPAMTPSLQPPRDGPPNTTQIPTEHPFARVAVELNLKNIQRKFVEALAKANGCQPMSELAHEIGVSVTSADRAMKVVRDKLRKQRPVKWNVRQHDNCFVCEPVAPKGTNRD